MTIRVRAVAAAVAIGAITLGAFAAPAATAAPVAPAAPVQESPAAADWAAADTAAIRPGVITETEGGGACTSNFIVTSGDRTFLGQAAHCAGTGAATETDGCDSGTGPLGTPVTIKAADGTERAGTLAYSSWITMQALGETDADTCAFNDFALVELTPSDVADVNPSVPFFGGPNGINTTGLVLGDMIFSYGNSPLRAGIDTLSPKTGVSAGDVGGGRGHEVYTASPGVPGDSGSAFLDSEGRALGILSTLNLAPLPVSNGVADFAKAMEYANAHGGLGALVLALGTEPFSSSSIGAPVALPGIQ